MSEHLKRRGYGRFQLTDALRPALDLRILPEEGYRRSLRRGVISGSFVSVVTCAASGEHLFDIFMEALDILAPTVDLVLRAGHAGFPTERRREQMDLVVLKSVFYDYEELILHDGSLGLSVFDCHNEVTFDEHKLLIVSGEDTRKSEALFHRFGIYHRRRLRFLTDSEHIHVTTHRRRLETDRLKVALGLDGDSLF
ncbi:MAG: hypothetical protein J6S75_04765 [Thermoguttaceae bacterium]|nr:hypothetical protein [Thermoguttaceae bacterium]